jgi:hypothetical protein
MPEPSISLPAFVFKAQGLIGTAHVGEIRPDNG